MGFSGYERTSKRTTCQKLAFQGKLAQLRFDDSNYTNPSKFDSVHNIRNQIKKDLCGVIRAKRDQNLPRQFAPQCDCLARRPSRCCSFKISNKSH